MKRSNLPIIWTFLYAVFGMGLLIVPVEFMAQYGVTLDENGVLIARVLGSALSAFAILFYLNRKIAVSEKSQYNLVFASMIYNIVDTPIVLLATLHGTMNSMGWMPVGIHVLLAVTMAYYIYKK
ncbi:MAG: hypothetical protein IPL46_02685 [Saprospiraceae bacterium]|nr:hypothetical protein [Saprospiraceae bacterium]